jgi:hypothetical protein
MERVRPIKSLIIVSFLRFTLIIGFAFLPGLWASGQVKFTTVVSSSSVGKGDYVQIEFVVENAKQIDDLTPPDFHGFTIVQGPIQSSGMSIVNGNMSQYKGLSFVLEPAKTGKFIIDGATAMVDGKRVRSNSVTVSVHPGGGSASAGPGAKGPGNPFGASPFGGGNPFAAPSLPDPFGREPGEVDRDYILKPGENVKEKIKKNLFVKIQVDKNSCYVGEPIVATYKLYSRLSSESRVTKRPSLNGFSVYDMVDPTQDAVSVERLNGKDYTVHIIRKTQLIPLQAGTIDLDPVEVENTVHFIKTSGRQEPHRSGNSLRDLIDQMNDEENLGPEVAENVTLDTKPLTITVKPLPEENRPAGFNGAVGNYSIEASVASQSMAAEDENTLHVVVKGKGNLPVMAAPTVEWPSGIETFDPTSKEDVNKTVAPMSGSKSFDYVFVPRSPGHITIPPISLPYFDPATQTYKTAGTGPLDIQVTPAVRNKRKPTMIEAVRDGSPSFTGRIGDLIREYPGWVCTLALLLGGMVYLLRQRRRKTVPADAGQTASMTQVGKGERQGVQTAHAIPVITSPTYLPDVPAPDPLREARELFESGNSKAFYQEINRAVWKTMSRKLDLPASELNKHNSLRQLQLRGWDDTALLSLESLLNECEMNLYTPAYDRHNMNQLLRQAEWVLDRLG